MPVHGRAVYNKCKYCSKMVKNKDYLPHLVSEHDDKNAQQIIDELRDLGE